MSEGTAFAIKNCKSQIPKEINFQNDDLDILDKFKNNLIILDLKLITKILNFILISLLIHFLMLINILMIKNLGKKKMIRLD